MRRRSCRVWVTGSRYTVPVKRAETQSDAFPIQHPVGMDISARWTGVGIVVPRSEHTIAQGTGLVFTTSVRHEVDARDTKGGQRAAMHGGHVPMNSALTFPSFAAGPRPPHKLRGVPQCWRNSNVTR